MKFTLQNSLMFGAGVIISGAILYAALTRSPVYTSFRIDAGKLQALYNGDFSKLKFNFLPNTDYSRVSLVPRVIKSNGGTGTLPPGMITNLSTGNRITGNRILSEYSLEHNRLADHYLQLQTLVALTNGIAGAYFECTAADFQGTHICYKIVAYRSNGQIIPVSLANAKAMQVNPCPPAIPY